MMEGILPAETHIHCITFLQFILLSQFIPDSID